MSPIIALAIKDIRLLFRNRGRIFFTFIWPIIVTVLFGFAFGGGGSVVLQAVGVEDNFEVIFQGQTDAAFAAVQD